MPQIYKQLNSEALLKKKKKGLLLKPFQYNSSISNFPSMKQMSKSNCKNRWKLRKYLQRQGLEGPYRNSVVPYAQKEQGIFASTRAKKGAVTGT